MTNKNTLYYIFCILALIFIVFTFFTVDLIYKYRKNKALYSIYEKMEYGESIETVKSKMGSPILNIPPGYNLKIFWGSEQLPVDKQDIIHICYTYETDSFLHKLIYIFIDRIDDNRLQIGFNKDNKAVAKHSY